MCSHIHKQNCQRMKQSVTISLLPAPPQRMKQSVTFSLLPAPRLLFLSLLNIFLGGARGEIEMIFKKSLHGSRLCLKIAFRKDSLPIFHMKNIVVGQMSV